MSTTEVLQETYYTPAEVAEKLRLKVDTIWKRIRLKKIKTVGGYRKLIPGSEFARLLEAK